MKKIQLLFFFLLSLSIVYNVKAQIVYVDINPDLNGATWNQTVLTTTFADWGGNAFATNPYNLANPRCMIIPASGDAAAILNQGDMIAPTSSWNGDAWNIGTVTDKYIGFRDGTAGNYKYGWFKISRTAAGVWTIKSYAYQNTVNTAIAAGDMGGPVAPVAAFTANATTAQTNVTTLTFTDQSTNTPTGWAWSFTPNTITYQNGTSATSQNPQVKFTAAGTYTVVLTATNATGNNTLTKTNYITVTNPPIPVAAFTANNTNPTTNTTTVTITDQSTNTPTSWNWTFTPNTVTYQNGTSATSQNPQVKFTANGQYTVKLKSTNANGSDSLTKTNYITASPPQAPTAAFISNPLAGVVNATVFNLTDQSLHTPTSWEWTFTPNNVTYQAGTSAASQFPQVKFTQPGTYTIKLKVINAQGADSLTKSNYVTVNVLPPVAQFTANATTGNAMQTQFTFTDQSTNGPTAWQWSFTPATVTYVNGTNANSQNPQITFNAVGTYAAKLLVSNTGGADSLTKTNYITVNPPVFAPDVDFTVDVMQAEKNITVVSFTDLSQFLPTSWRWTITPNTFVFQNNANSTTQNPSVKFTAPGNYTVKLKATNAQGSDSLTKTAFIKVSGSTAVEDLNQVNKVLNIFPNPADNYLNIELQQGVKIQSVTVVNLEGKVVAVYNQLKGNKIDISSLSKGMYFLKMQFENEGKAEFRKFSKL